LLEADALIVGDVGLSVNRVLSDASTSTTDSTDVTQSDVRTTGGNGAIVVRTTAGSITLNNGTAPGASADSRAISAHGTGSILVQAQGASSDVLVNADVVGTTGHLSVVAGRTVALAAGTAIATTGSGGVQVLAAAGNLTMAPDAVVSSVSGDILLSAGDDVSDQLTLGAVTATNANVALVTPGSVLDSDTAASALDTSTVDVSARGLIILAGLGAGLLAGNSLSAPVNAIETSVDTLSARIRGSDGLNLVEANQLVIGDVISQVDPQQGVQVYRVLATGGTESLGVLPHSDVVTESANGASGNIVLRTLNGSIVLREGAAAVDLDSDAAVVAHGAGNVLLQASGTGAEIVAEANADIQST
ncbi:MAG: hypothetical protein EB027_08005, partial [Actinobacteria bacterium]|nr:hypothetical protein [Actinomycetota bacterium]